MDFIRAICLPDGEGFCTGWAIIVSLIMLGILGVISWICRGGYDGKKVCENKPDI